VGTAERVSATTGVAQLYIAVPGKYRGLPVAVRVSEPARAVRELVWQTRTPSLLALVAALVLAVLVAWRLSVIATAPVERLADSARRMAAGDLSGAVPIAEGELGELSVALARLRDQMRDRVARLETERRDLRTVLDGLTDAVFLVEDGKVTVANASASELFTTPFGGWAGRALDDRVLPASIAAATGSQLADVARAGPRGVAVREIGPDPNGRWLRVTVLALPVASERTGRSADRALLIFSDVTERMRLDKMRTDFVANASHELKTPTAAIGLLADSAKTAAGDGDTDQAMSFLGQIGAEADRLRRLVADLLDLSRLEVTPKPGSVTNVRVTANLSMTAHTAAARHKGLGLTEDLTGVAGQDVYVLADPTDVAVALDNLLDNAIAYTESGGVVVLVSADPAWVDIAIADTGVGIPAEDLDRVFERFYRVDRSRTRGTGGTGLGLALVRHIAERSGGSVQIDSTVGVGTTVTLTMPRA
jgi:two-component system phosphate regulon sensor histidine kinase PhoR